MNIYLKIAISIIPLFLTFRYYANGWKEDDLPILSVIGETLRVISFLAMTILGIKGVWS